MPVNCDKDCITYYGEYTLDNWIKMILNNEITLPEYQRYFVWNANMAISLLNNLTNGLFVPPIVLAAYSGDQSSKSTVLVLDGQQRLSSILLCYLGYWPVVFQENSELASDDTDSNDAFEEQIESTPALNWDFKELQTLYEGVDNIDELKTTLKKDRRYKKIEDVLFESNNKKTINIEDIKINIDTIFKNSFLGFSFIKNKTKNSNNEKKLFSEIFRSINISSVSLTQEESRAALYWLNPERKGFLMPEFTSSIKVNNNKFDWARCLAYVSQANKIYTSTTNKHNLAYKVAIGYGRNPRPFEQYIELFV